jgi:Flp pilus assembly protein TadG
MDPASATASIDQLLPGLYHRTSVVRAVRRVRSREAGSQMIEFSLVLLPLLAFVFLIMDVAWICFAQASIQHAVQVGVRAAVTNTLPSAASSMTSYVKSVVQNNAMGFLNGPDGLDKITITYFDPSSLKAAVSASRTAGGNVIQVSVSNVTVNALGPILRTDTAQWHLSAIASDVLESPPDNKLPNP